MDIKKYTSYFHDGFLVDIKFVKDDLLLTMFSAEVHPEDFDEGIELAFDELYTIRGRLHIEKVTSILINEKPELELKMKTGPVIIYDFELKENEVEIQIIWNNKTSPELEEFESIKISCQASYWENLPNLNYPIEWDNQ